VPDELFQRVAHEHNIRAPSPFCPADEWHAYCRKVWSHYPRWGWDIAFLTEHVALQLPRVLAALRVGKLHGFIASYARAVAGRHVDGRLHLLPLEPEGRWLIADLEPRVPAWPRHLLALDTMGFPWRVPSLARQGEDIVSLAAWRWEVNEAKAAYRLARALGLQGAVP